MKYSQRFLKFSVAVVNVCVCVCPIKLISSHSNAPAPPPPTKKGKKTVGKEYELPGSDVSLLFFFRGLPNTFR